MCKKAAEHKILPLFTFPNGFVLFPICNLLCRASRARCARCTLRNDKIQGSRLWGTAVCDGGVRAGFARGYRPYFHGRRRAGGSRRSRGTSYTCGACCPVCACRAGVLWEKTF